MSVRWIAFHITDRCQLNCQHCLRDPGLKPKDVDVDVVDRVLAEARRLYDPEEVALTGGEPTLHPRFYDIVDSAVRHGYGWHMVSNGERFADVMAALDTRPERRAHMTSVTLSLDGAEEQTHDAIRGAGSFRSVMTAVAVAAAREIPFTLQMTPNRTNVAELEAFALLAAQLGARSVVFSALQPTGTMHDWSLYLPLTEHVRVVERVRRLGTILAIPVRADEGFVVDDPLYMCSTFANHTLHFDPQGQLNLCCKYSGIPIGSGDSTSLADVREVGLVEAHRRMIRASADTLLARLSARDSGFADAWERAACNFCLKAHGAAHWTDAGPRGPVAARERWRGAWTPDPDLVALAASRRREIAGDDAGASADPGAAGADDA